VQRSEQKLLIIGGGGSGESLLRRLDDAFQSTVIEIREPRIKELKENFIGTNHNFIVGDGTSPIALESTSPREADNIIVLLPDDKSTSECIKILKEKFERRSIIARVQSSSVSAVLRSKGITVIRPAEMQAVTILNQLNLGETIALNIGKGEGEIIQLELTKSSPIIGRELRELPPRSWLIGAIYRPRKRLQLSPSIRSLKQLHISQEDELIIPSGKTKPQAGDKILLIGDPQILRATARYLKAGASVFPLRHGDTVFSLFLEKERDVAGFQEFCWLLSRMEPCHIEFIFSKQELEPLVKKIKVPDNWEASNRFSREEVKITKKGFPTYLREYQKTERIGMVIYRDPKSILKKVLHRLFFLRKLIPALREFQTPLWVIRGRNRIKQIVLFVTVDDGCLPAAEMAFDAADRMKLPMKLVQIYQPKLLTGEAARERMRNQLTAVRDTGHLYGIKCEEVILEGNPFRELRKHVTPAELLVFSYPRNSLGGFLIPNVAKFLLYFHRSSILCLPT
jgi:uncharacterized protein